MVWFGYIIFKCKFIHQWQHWGKFSSSSHDIRNPFTLISSNHKYQTFLSDDVTRALTWNCCFFLLRLLCTYFDAVRGVSFMSLHNLSVCSFSHQQRELVLNYWGFSVIQNQFAHSTVVSDFTFQTALISCDVNGHWGKTDVLFNVIPDHVADIHRCLTNGTSRGKK